MQTLTIAQFTEQIVKIMWLTVMQLWVYIATVVILWLLVAYMERKRHGR